MSAAGDVARTVTTVLVEAGLAAAKAVHEGSSARDALFAAQEVIANELAREKFATFRDPKPEG